MKLREISVTPQAIAELRTLLDSTKDEGSGKFTKPFREFCERHAWNWFGLDPKPLFTFNAINLFAAYSHSQYANDRLKQLQERNIAHWVFHAHPDCPAEHARFDQLVLSPEHCFWQNYTPPLGWQCGCYVSGANSPSGVKRLGGDLTKNLPDGWDVVDRLTGLHLGIEEPWSSQHAPDLLLLIAALVDGHAPKPFWNS